MICEKKLSVAVAQQFRSVAVPCEQNALTEGKCWTVHYDRSVWSNFLFARKFVRCRLLRVLRWAKEQLYTCITLLIHFRRSRLWLVTSLFHVLWSTWTRFIWYRSSSAQTSLNNYRILSKPRYYVNSDILVKLYYALIYPFLTYGLISWGNTYSSTTQPLFILQKRAMRMMTFSELNFVSILV